MKIRIELTEEEVTRALATYASEFLGLECEASQVIFRRYTSEMPRIEMDTDEVQEMASIAAAQEHDVVTDFGQVIKVAA